MEQGINTDEGTRGITPNANVQSAVAQLWDVIRRAGEILVSVREDNRSLAARIAALEQRMGGQEDQVSGVLAEAEALRAALEQREDDIAVLRSVVEQTERDRAAGETAAGELRDRVIRYEETIRRLTSHIAEQDEQIGALAGTAEEHRRLKEELAFAADRESAFQTTLGELNEKLAAAMTASKDVDFLRAELVRRNTELNTRIKEALYHKERAAELENKLYELQQAQAALRETRSSLDTIGEELAAAQQARAEAERRAAEAEEHCEDILHRSAEQQQQLEESRAMEQDLLVRIQQLHDDNDAVRRRAEEQQKHIVELSEQLIQLKAQLQEYDIHNRGQSETMESIAGELDTARRQVEYAEAQRRALQEERDSVEQARRTAEEECDRLRRTCTELAEELQHVARSSVARDVIEEKEAQIVELLAQVEEKEREAEYLRHRLDDVQTVGSLFAIARHDGTGAASGPAMEDRSAVIASVQALLQKVEHVLRADPNDGN